MFRNGLVFRVVAAVILIGLAVAGGFMAYNAGQANGISQAPAVATAIQKAADNGQSVPVPPMMYGHGYGYGYGGYPMGGHFFGFFPFGICASIFFLFLFFGLLRVVFFGRMHHGGMHGPWGRHWEDGVPPMFSDWHKRAHGESTDSEPARAESK